MSPPPEYSHSFAQTTGDHEDTTSKRLSQIYPIQDVDEDADGKTTRRHMHATAILNKDHSQPRGHTIP